MLSICYASFTTFPEFLFIRGDVFSIVAVSPSQTCHATFHKMLRVPKMKSFKILLRLSIRTHVLSDQKLIHGCVLYEAQRFFSQQ